MKWWELSYIWEGNCLKIPRSKVTSACTLFLQDFLMHYSIFHCAKSRMQDFSFCKRYRIKCWYLWRSTGTSFNILVFFCKTTGQIYFRTREHFRASFFDKISLFSFFLLLCQRYRWVSRTRTLQSIPWIQGRLPCKYTASSPASWQKPEHTPEYFLLLPHLFLPSKIEGKKPNQPTLNKNPKHK